MPVRLTTLPLRCPRCYLILLPTSFRPISSHFRPHFRFRLTLVIVRVKALALKHYLPLRKWYVPRRYPAADVVGHSQLLAVSWPSATTAHERPATRARIPAPNSSSYSRVKKSATKPFDLIISYIPSNSYSSISGRDILCCATRNIQQSLQNINFNVEISKYIMRKKNR